MEKAEGEAEEEAEIEVEEKAEVEAEEMAYPMVGGAPGAIEIAEVKIERGGVASYRLPVASEAPVTKRQCPVKSEARNQHREDGIRVNAGGIVALIGQRQQTM